MPGSFKSYRCQLTHDLFREVYSSYCIGQLLFLYHHVFFSSCHSSCFKLAHLSILLLYAYLLHMIVWSMMAGGSICNKPLGFKGVFQLGMWEMGMFYELKTDDTKLIEYIERGWDGWGEKSWEICQGPVRQELDSEGSSKYTKQKSLDFML